MCNYYHFTLEYAKTRSKVMLAIFYFLSVQEFTLINTLKRFKLALDYFISQYPDRKIIMFILIIIKDNITLIENKKILKLVKFWFYFENFQIETTDSGTETLNLYLKYCQWFKNSAKKFALHKKYKKRPNISDSVFSLLVKCNNEKFCEYFLPVLLIFVMAQ